jgi:molecular chaperone GrpE
MEMYPMPAGARNEEARERILRRFEEWLDSALADEEPLQAVAADLLAAYESGGPLPPIEGNCDLYSLWSAMTVLSQEVKLQSRTFRQLNDALAQLLERTAQTTPSSPAQAVEKNTREVDLLLDLHDRLDRGIKSVRVAETTLISAPPKSLWKRWFGAGKQSWRQTAETLAAIEKGYALTLDRLNQELRDLYLTPIACEGQPFDSHRMTAVEIEVTGAVPDGTVLGVYRSGYERDGEVYRSAQVKVSRSLRS